MTADMELILRQTIELGRSFIVNEYQRKPVSLMLLWKGILNVLLRHDEFRYLMGPVTISGEFQNSSKLLIAAYLAQSTSRPRKCATHPSPDRYRRAGTDRRDADRRNRFDRADQQDRMRYRTESFHDPDPDPKIPAGRGARTRIQYRPCFLRRTRRADPGGSGSSTRKDHSDVIQRDDRYRRDRPVQPVPADDTGIFPSCRAYDSCIIFRPL